MPKPDPIQAKIAAAELAVKNAEEARRPLAEALGAAEADLAEKEQRYDRDPSDKSGAAVIAARNTRDLARVREQSAARAEARTRADLEAVRAELARAEEARRAQLAAEERAGKIARLDALRAQIGRASFLEALRAEDVPEILVIDAKLRDLGARILRRIAEQAEQHQEAAQLAAEIGATVDVEPIARPDGVRLARVLARLALVEAAPPRPPIKDLHDWVAPPAGSRADAIWWACATLGGIEVPEVCKFVDPEQLLGALVETGRADARAIEAEGAFRAALQKVQSDAATYKDPVALACAARLERRVYESHKRQIPQARAEELAQIIEAGAAALDEWLKQHREIIGPGTAEYRSEDGPSVGAEAAWRSPERNPLRRAA